MTTTVLLVDDDPGFRRLARAMVEGPGFTVVGEVGTVAGALAAARELQPDSALVDVELPDGDGVTLAGTLTAAPYPPRVILTSSDAGAVEPGDVARSGAAGFVPKTELPGVGLGELLAGS